MSITKQQLAQQIDDISVAYQRGSIALDGIDNGITLTAAQVTLLQLEYIALHDSVKTFFASLTSGVFDLTP